MPAMRTAAIDSFDRANGALGSADSGQSWTSGRGTWAISGNKAQSSTSSTTNVGAVASVDTYSRVQRVSISVASRPNSGTWVGLVSRMTDVDNLWFAFVYGSNDGSHTYLYCGKCVAGALTYVLADTLLVASGGTMSPTRISLETTNDNALVLRRDGLQVGTSVRDAFNATGTKAGLLTNGNEQVLLDDFLVEVPVSGNNRALRRRGR